MDWRLRKCRRVGVGVGVLKPCTSRNSGGVDRLTSLPVELLSNILSALSTKEVAAIQLVSKTMRTLAFTCVTCLDFDFAPISFCKHHPNLIHRFPLFESFVDKTLSATAGNNQLTRFRLRVGGDFSNHFGSHLPCRRHCFPNVVPSRLHAWISYPLTHPGLRELDLSFHLNIPSSYKLPRGLFACQSLEVLKLDSNIANLTAADVSLISLPNLKLLHLESITILEDDSVATLVSACPSLEDLSICCWWRHCDRVAISSHSLRRLVLRVYKRQEEKTTNLVLIDAPNVEYLLYDDDPACRYSITYMNALIQAQVCVCPLWVNDSLIRTLEAQLSLVRMLSNIQHLSLYDSFVENMCCGSEFYCELPVFDNLKTLELDCGIFEQRYDKVLLKFLTCSPSLETLAFPRGFFLFIDSSRNSPANLEIADLERQGWETTEATPQCLKSNLKRVVIEKYKGTTRELNMIKFLLRKAAVLHELVVVHSSPPSFDVLANHILSESILDALPRASTTCSFRVS